MPDDATDVATFTNPVNWQGVDDEPTAGSDNLVKSGAVSKVLSPLDINNPDVFNVVDANGNIVAQISRNGLKAIDFITKDGRSLSELISNFDFSSNDELNIIDNYGYVVCRIDKYGITSVNDYSYPDLMNDFGKIVQVNNSNTINIKLYKDVNYRVRIVDGGTISGSVTFNNGNLSFTLDTTHKEIQIKPTGNFNKLFVNGNDSFKVEFKPITYPTVFKDFRYLVATFNSELTESPYTEEKSGMWLMGTHDLRKFDTIGHVYKPAIQGLRDPSVCFYKGFFYFIYTIHEMRPDDGYSQQRYVGQCRTRDFVNFEELNNTTIDGKTLANIDFNNQMLWAPQFCWDENTGKYYVVLTLLSQVQGEEGGVYACEYDFDTFQLKNPIYLPNSSYDTQMLFHEGYYYFFTVPWKMYRSRTIGGETELVKDFCDAGVDDAEAPFVIKMSDGRFRWFSQGLLDEGVDDHRMYYRDSLTSDLAGDWSDRQVINFTEDTGTPYVHGYPAGYPSHWTIIDLCNKQ